MESLPKNQTDPFAQYSVWIADQIGSWANSEGHERQHVSLGLADRDYGGNVKDASMLAGSEADGIQPDERPVAFDWSFQERLHPSIDVFDRQS